MNRLKNPLKLALLQILSSEPEEDTAEDMLAEDEASTISSDNEQEGTDEAENTTSSIFG